MNSFPKSIETVSRLTPVPPINVDLVGSVCRPDQSKTRVNANPLNAVPAQITHAMKGFALARLIMPMSLGDTQITCMSIIQPEKHILTSYVKYDEPVTVSVSAEAFKHKYDWRGWYNNKDREAEYVTGVVTHFNGSYYMFKSTDPGTPQDTTIVAVGHTNTM